MNKNYRNKYLSYDELTATLQGWAEAWGWSKRMNFGLMLSGFTGGSSSPSALCRSVTVARIDARQARAGRC